MSEIQSRPLSQTQQKILEQVYLDNINIREQIALPKNTNQQDLNSSPSEAAAVHESLHRASLEEQFLREDFAPGGKARERINLLVKSLSDSEESNTSKKPKFRHPLKTIIFLSLLFNAIVYQYTDPKLLSQFRKAMRAKQNNENKQFRISQVKKFQLIDDEILRRLKALQGSSNSFYSLMIKDLILDIQKDEKKWAQNFIADKYDLMFYIKILEDWLPELNWLVDSLDKDIKRQTKILGQDSDPLKAIRAKEIADMKSLNNLLKKVSTKVSDQLIKMPKYKDEPRLYHHAYAWEQSFIRGHLSRSSDIKARSIDKPFAKMTEANRVLYEIPEAKDLDGAHKVVKHFVEDADKLIIICPWAHSPQDKYGEEGFKTEGRHYLGRMAFLYRAARQSSLLKALTQLYKKFGTRLGETISVEGVIPAGEYYPHKEDRHKEYLDRLADNINESREIIKTTYRQLYNARGKAEREKYKEEIELSKLVLNDTFRKLRILQFQYVISAPLKLASKFKLGIKHTETIEFSRNRGKELDENKGSFGPANDKAERYAIQATLDRAKPVQIMFFGGGHNTWYEDIRAYCADKKNWIKDQKTGKLRAPRVSVAEMTSSHEQRSKAK